MTEASSPHDSPFAIPKMECRGCGKNPHEGYCYPVFDGLIGVLTILAVCVCIPIIVVVLSGL